MGYWWNELLEMSYTLNNNLLKAINLLYLCIIQFIYSLNINNSHLHWNHKTHQGASQLCIWLKVNKIYPILFIILQTHLLHELFAPQVGAVTDHVDNLQAGSTTHTPMLLVGTVVDLDLLYFFFSHLLNSAFSVSFQDLFLLSIGGLELGNFCDQLLVSHSAIDVGDLCLKLFQLSLLLF